MHFLSNLLTVSNIPILFFYSDVFVLCLSFFGPIYCVFAIEGKFGGWNIGFSVCFGALWLYYGRQELLMFGEGDNASIVTLSFGRHFYMIIMGSCHYCRSNLTSAKDSFRNVDTAFRDRGMSHSVNLLEIAWWLVLTTHFWDHRMSIPMALFWGSRDVHSPDKFWRSWDVHSPDSFLESAVCLFPRPILEIAGLFDCTSLQMTLHTLFLFSHKPKFFIS